MITAWIVASYIIAGIALVDQLRRPPSAWAAADRIRSWWVGATVALGFFACGIFIGFAYLIGVVPRFGTGHAVDPAFRKSH